MAVRHWLVVVALLFFPYGLDHAMPGAPDVRKAMNDLTQDRVGNRIKKSGTVEFHITSSAGWSIKGVTSWILFVAIVRSTLQPHETIEIIKLVPAPP